MTETADPYYVNLLKSKGLREWQKILGRAKRGALVYGVALILIAIGTFASITYVTTELNADLIFRVAAGIATLYAATTQVGILPWLRTHSALHWTLAVLFSMVGLFAVLLLFFMWTHIAKVQSLIFETHLGLSEQEANEETEPTERKRRYRVYSTIPEFSDWIARLDDQLEDIGSKADSTKYSIGEQRYAFAHGIEPDEFLATYPRKRLSQEEFEVMVAEKIGRESEPRSEAAPMKGEFQIQSSRLDIADSQVAPSESKNSLQSEEKTSPDASSSAVRLREVQDLFDQGLISADQLKAKQEEILREI